MTRTRPAVRIALLVYVLEAALLAPLHMLMDEVPASMPMTIGIGSPCATGGEPCQDPEHRHPLSESSHQADHCPACNFAGRPAIESGSTGPIATPAVAGQVWLTPEERPLAGARGPHTPRGPPSSRLA